jgi:hypothetical protein
MGLTTIRTSNSVEKLNEEFFSITDYHTRAMLTFTYVNRWLAVRLEWVAAVFSFIVTFSFIFLKSKLN